MFLLDNYFFKKKFEYSTFELNLDSKISILDSTRLSLISKNRNLSNSIIRLLFIGLIHYPILEFENNIKRHHEP